MNRIRFPCMYFANKACINEFTPIESKVHECKKEDIFSYMYFTDGRYA